MRQSKEFGPCQFGCLSWRGCCPWQLGVQTSSDAQHPTVHRTALHQGIIWPQMSVLSSIIANILMRVCICDENQNKSIARLLHMWLVTATEDGTADRGCLSPITESSVEPPFLEVQTFFPSRLSQSREDITGAVEHRHHSFICGPGLGLYHSQHGYHRTVLSFRTTCTF